MKSERELFKLAQNMVHIESKLEENISEFLREELIEEASEIRRVLFRKGYDANQFLDYKELYKSLSVEEYYRFIKTLE